MYDYIVIGAGSAGCAVAARLSEDPQAKVLVLEAGGPDSTPLIHMPAGILHLVESKYDWAYYTLPQTNLNRRRLYWPRGKTLGGSSSINAMIYIRGQALDYDHWRQLGNPGWAWDDVLPYFRKAENNERGADDLRATGGPLNVADLVERNPLTDVFLTAAGECGIAPNRDFNGKVQEGVGPYQVTQRGGKRCSAAVAYLHPAMSRPNLTVVTGAHTTRIVIEQGRAVGVEYVRRGARTVARASAEVVLSGGAINSPQLLMLSGIGPADELKQVGVTPVHDLPGVGRNLQDHLNVNVINECTRPITYDGLDKPIASLKVAAKYFLMKKGPGTSNAAEAGGFLRSDPAVASPDIQLHFIPAYIIDHARVRPDGHGLTLHSCCLRPRSSGRITLASSDPLVPPAIDPNYLADEADLKVLVEGIKRCRDIFAAPAFRPYVGPERYPGAAARSDAELAAFVRQSAETEYHPVGTCKMGIDDMAVVDPELKVRGVAGLRVADASIMPAVVSGNTNAPSIMIGEKAAALIRGATFAA